VIIRSSVWRIFKNLKKFEIKRQSWREVSSSSSSLMPSEFEHEHLNRWRVGPDLALFKVARRLCSHYIVVRKLRSTVKQCLSSSTQKRNKTSKSENPQNTSTPIKHGAKSSNREGTTATQVYKTQVAELINVYHHHTGVLDSSIRVKKCYY
jgi:hypothetical protein